ncbi:MAG: DUF192 domain-containing protein [bacterium]
MGPLSVSGASRRRLNRLSVLSVCGISVPLASTASSRLLGLALLDPEDAGNGLLIPRCSAVHTFGMRFDLDITFCDRSLRPLREIRGAGPRRFFRHSAAWAVLEVPSGRGGRGF